MTRQLDITLERTTWFQQVLDARVFDDVYATRVYVIRELHGDPSVKIGIADDPHARLIQLQRGNPRLLELVGHFAGTKRLERFIHRKLSPQRIHGEWFRLDARGWDLIDDVLRSLCEMAEDMAWEDAVDDTRWRFTEWAEPMIPA